MRAERILVIDLGGAGELLLSIPALRALRQDSAQRRIAIVVAERAAEVLEGGPRLDRIVSVPAQIGLSGWIRFRREIRAERPAAAIDLTGSRRSCMLGLLSGAPVRVGYQSRAPRAITYTHAVPNDPMKYGADARLDLVRAIGIADRGVELEIHPSESDRASAARLLERAGVAAGTPLLAIAPGGRAGARAWPAEGFASVALWAQEELRAVVVLIEGAGAGATMEEMRRLLPGGGRWVAAPRSLRSLAAVIERVHVLLAADSDAALAAIAVGVPSVTLHGGSQAARAGVPDAPTHRALVLDGDLSGQIREAYGAIGRLW